MQRSIHEALRTGIACDAGKIPLLCCLLAILAGPDLHDALITSDQVKVRPTWTGVLVGRAYAGDEKSEAEKKALEQQREAAKKEQERQREASKKEQERQREADKKEQEHQREAAKKEQERQREATKQEQERQRETNKKEQERQRETAKKDRERQQPETKTKKSKVKTDDDDDDDERSAGSNGAVPSQPPATLVEVFRRLRKKSSRGSDSEERKRSSGRSGNSGSGSSSRRGRGRSYSGGRGRSFKGDEVIGLNLSGRALSRAREYGFKVKSSTLVSGLKSSVTRLIAPPGTSAVQARRILQRELPGRRFTFNRIYRGYHAAKGNSVGPGGNAASRDGRKARAPQPRRGQRIGRRARRQPCLADHCLGRELIKWNEKLKTCSDGVPIGIIDTAIDHAHPAFRGRAISAGSFAPEESPTGSDWHGTAVLSVLAGDPASGVPGLVPHAKFFAADVFYVDDKGHLVTDTVSLLKALDWMETWNVKIINMSFTGPKDELVRSAIDRMSKSGTIFVAAAGNEGPGAPPGYPAAYRDVIAVTAVDKRLRSYRRANRGDYVDVAAPGVGIWTALPDRRAGYQSGTSYAVPYVTALLATVYEGHARKTSPDALIKSLPMRDLGPRGRDPIYGHGLVIAPERCGPGEPGRKPGRSAPPRVAKTVQQPRARDNPGLVWRSPNSTEILGLMAPQ